MVTYVLAFMSALGLAYFGGGALYQFILSLAGIFYKNPEQRAAQRLRRTAIFIPAYREDAVILSSVKAALEQDYPEHLYQVVVIADQLTRPTLSKLRQLPIQIVEVAFEKSTKAKALNQALKVMKEWNFEVAVILDADNVMQKDFLNRINDRFEAGARAIQGRRAAKNFDSPMATLDAASEDVNMHILCRGSRTLGLSARLAGSGMAFDYRMFEAVMPQIKAIGGFDKELELRLTEAGIRLEYDHEAIVFDEKTQQTQAFTKQRSRWLAAQYTYAKRFVPAAIVALITRGNLDFFNKAIQMTLPPRLLLPAVLMIGALGNALLSIELAAAWSVFFVLNIASFLIAMPSYCFRKENFSALLHLPRALTATFKALTQLRLARQQFIHTPHQAI